jgi:hypothetical protein
MEAVVLKSPCQISVVATEDADLSAILGRGLTCDHLVTYNARAWTRYSERWPTPAGAISSTYSTNAMDER